MRAFKILVISLYFLIPLGCFSAIEPILFLNEISQGTEDGQEYAEFAILGGCHGGPTTLDLRKLIIDDNEGLYASGPGSNISTGALRFADIPFWQAVPQGTIIVIYNEANRNPAIPPDDISINDGNYRLILPANSILLEGQGTGPTPTNSSLYGNWTAGGGLWSYISLEDSGDTFRLQASWTSNFYFNAISWGTNTGTFQTPDEYFAGSATGLVFYVDMHVAIGGWISAPAATSQTPGEPNNSNNYRWIYRTMEALPLQISLTSTQELCFNACDVSIFSDFSGGTAPYDFTWNTPSANGPVIHNRCPGTYSVTITDVDGCTATSEITIEAAEEIQVSVSATDETCAGACDGNVVLTTSGGTGPLTVSWSDGSAGTTLTELCPDDYYAVVQDSMGCIIEVETMILAAPPIATSVFASAGPFHENDPPVQLQNSIAGGTYTTSDCVACLTPGGTFDPSAAGQGTFNICYTLLTGSCSSVQCRQITVGPCTPKHTSETIYICEGDSALIFGNWETQQDLFSNTFAGVSCDSIHKVTLLYYYTPDEYTTLSLCEGDSLQVFGNWVDSSGIFSQEMQSGMGCRYMKYITVIESFCAEEALVYIPNAFTPDGDQVNDIFRIEMLGAIVLEGYIYNRWGEIVARFDEHNLTWNGNNEQGKPAPDGVYVYVVRYFTVLGVNEEKVGHVTLLR